METRYGVLNILWLDFLRYGRPKKKSEFLKLVIVNPGFRAVVFIRIITQMPTQFRFLAKMLKIRLLQRYGCDIDIDATFGYGLRIEHPVGLVIGKGARIASCCTIAQGVTIGEKYIDSRSTAAYPLIGHGVSIGAGAVIIGGIEIGSGSTIGACALVLTNVPSDTLVVGIWN